VIVFSPVGARPSRNRYSGRVAEAIKAIRGDLSTQAFADRLTETMGVRVYKSQVLNWEHGRNVPRADVLLAALAIAGSSRMDLPSPLGADAASVAAIDTVARLRDIELKVADLQQFRRRIEDVFRPQ
jgi:hypothetical protein